MNTKLIINDKNGQKNEYDILLTFHFNKTNKQYIVYTDNKYNENDELNIYANIYENNELKNIETEEEWNEVDNRLSYLQKLGEN